MLDRHITRTAAWLSKPIGFLATLTLVAVGVGAGWHAGFDDRWSLVFNLFLSIAALLIAGLILVAGARDTAAIQAKLDALLRAVPDAPDALIGLDQRSDEEIAAARENC